MQLCLKDGSAQAAAAAVAAAAVAAIPVPSNMIKKKGRVLPSEGKREPSHDGTKIEMSGKKSSRGKPGFQPRPSNTQTSARKAGFLLRSFFLSFFFSFSSLSPFCVLRACACVRGWYTVDESRLPAKKETNKRWSDQWLPGNGLRSRPSGLDLGSAGEVSCKDASILGKREQETSGPNRALNGSSVALRKERKRKWDARLSGSNELASRYRMPDRPCRVEV